MSNMEKKSGFSLKGEVNSGQTEREALPEWFDAFLTNVCEIPDRNSPEGEPEAIVATLEELRSCAINAIENCEPSTGICFFCGEPIDGKHESDCPQAEQSAAPMASKQADEAVSDAARDVLAERQRQVTAEGWTPAHDDEHDCGQLAGAASCYASHVNGRQWVFFDGRHDDYKSEPTPDYWPWDESWWKPTTPRRDLVKAGALILAEIERIDRLAAQPASSLAEGDKQ